MLVDTAIPVKCLPTMTEGKTDGSRIVADCTIGGDRGMLVLQVAKPDKTPVPPGEGTSNVTMRLCAIVGVALLIAGGLVPGMMRSSANFATRSDEPSLQVTESVAKDDVQLKSPVVESNTPATISKIPTAPSPPAPEAASTPPSPMQVAKSIRNVTVRSAGGANSQIAENDLAVTVGKQTTSSLPSVATPELAPTGVTPKPTSESALAPVMANPMTGPGPQSGGAKRLDENEIAMLVRRGKDFLKDGDLASARLLLQRAAAAGNAEAAFILGTTFDPLFMRRMGVIGAEPDITRAREWYKRAAELGSTEASQQLATPQRRY